ncbi:MAG: hypothetical protein WC238_01105 [Parcubacteria group bacterium]|jgi:hypothetical protein
MKNNTKINFLDGLGRKKDNRLQEFDLPLAKYVTKYKNSSVLFSKSRRAESFFTEDSKLYFTPAELRRLQRGERIVRLVNRLDNLQSRVFENSKIYSTSQTDFLTLKIKRSYAKFRAQAVELAQDSTRGISVVKMWNLSIVGAVIFGMFTMTMIYRYLGQGVSAQIQETQVAQTQMIQQAEIKAEKDAAIAEMTKVDMDSITSLLSEQNEKADLEREIMEMVKGHPIEEMVPQIAKQERVVAAFLIGIARQESAWGVRVPVYQGKDCYNYWGWRGKNAVGTGGHTCFASKEEAVATVAKRIKFLVSNQKLNTPEKMIVWKCGDCSWDSQVNMQRWINSVGIYFKKLNTE